MATTTGERSTRVEKEPLPYRAGHRYALLTDDRGTTLSVHDSSEPGFLWVAGHGPNGGGRPARLDLDQARALREALTNWIADQKPQRETSG